MLPSCCLQQLPLLAGYICLARVGHHFPSLVFQAETADKVLNETAFHLPLLSAIFLIAGFQCDLRASRKGGNGKTLVLLSN